MSQNARAVIGLVVISTIVGTCYAIASGPADGASPSVSHAAAVERADSSTTTTARVRPDFVSLHEAAAICEEFVKPRLLAPAAAKFPSIYSSEVAKVQLDSARYHVSSHVDAQNTYGVPIRHEYACVVKKVPGSDQWTLEELVM